MRAARTGDVWQTRRTHAVPAHRPTLDGVDAMMLSGEDGTLPIRSIRKVRNHLPRATTSLGKPMFMHMAREQIDGHLGIGGKTLRDSCCYR